MRHIGYEIAPHGLGLLDSGDVLGQQQMLFLTVGKELQGQALGHLWAVLTAIDDDGFAVVVVLQVAVEVGVAHQVADQLRHVTRRIDPQVLGGHGVAPGDAPFAVQHQHPVGRGLNGRQELLQAGSAGVQLAIVAAGQATHAVHDIAPNAPGGGQRLIGGGEPIGHPIGPPQIDRVPRHSAPQEAPSRALRHGGGVGQAPPQDPTQGQEEDKRETAAQHDFWSQDSEGDGLALKRYPAPRTV